MREGWAENKLGNLCVVLDNQRKPVAKINRNKGNYPYYGANGLLDYVDDYIFDGRYVLIGEDGANWDNNASSSYIVEGKTWVNNHAHVIKVNDLLNDEYLVYYLNYKDLNKFISGAIIKKLTQSSLKEITIEFPEKNYQEKIVKELNMITEMISKYDEQLKELDKLSQSIFYEMFGDPVENEKGWEVKKLEEISREIGDGLHGTPVYTQYNTGYFFINGNNLENGVICIKENTKMVSEDTKCKYHIDMDTSTILVSINGTLGKTAIYNGENVILGKSACYIKLNSDVNKVYIHEIIKSDYFKKYANDESTGTTIKNVSLKSMRHFPIILPPLPLQQSFARKIEAIEAMKSKVREAKKEAETLLAARMQYWFE